MPLSEKQIAALTSAAARHGVSVQELIAAGEKELGGSKAIVTDRNGRPTFERLLIGAFGVLKVRELRQHWLGLDERIEDDEMIFGDFMAKHGGGLKPTTE